MSLQLTLYCGLVESASVRLRFNPGDGLGLLSERCGIPYDTVVCIPTEHTELILAARSS